MKTKKLITLMLSVAMILGLIGCGNQLSDTVDSTETVEVPAEGGKLTLAVQAADDVRISILDDYIVPNFETAFPGWELETSIIGTDQASIAAMKTYNSTGDLPDVYWSDAVYCLPMISAGNQLDLSKKITLDGFDDKYSSVDFMKYKGGIYALQPGSDAQYFPVFYYNTEIFEANGIKVPTSLEELFAACDKLVANGIQPISMEGTGGYLGMGWFQTLLALKDPAKVQGLLDGEIDFTDPVILEVMETLETMFEKGYFGDRMITSATTPAEHRENFIAGNCAMILDFYWQWSVYDNGITDVFLIPRDDGETVMQVWGNSVAGYAVYSGSEHVDMAVKLAEYCCEQEAIYHNEHGTATGFDTGIAVEVGSELQQKLNDMYNETTFKQNTIWSNALDSYVAGEMRTLFSGFIAGQYTSQEFLEEFQPIFEENTIFE